MCANSSYSVITSHCWAAPGVSAAPRFRVIVAEEAFALHGLSDNCIREVWAHHGLAAVSLTGHGVPQALLC